MDELAVMYVAMFHEHLVNRNACHGFTVEVRMMYVVVLFTSKYVFENSVHFWNIKGTLIICLTI